MDGGSTSLKNASKKRTRNPTEWKREKRKRLRIAGKSYVNSRGDLINERKIGEDCKCRRKCYSLVTEDQRNKLFVGYYSLNSHDEQNAYLFDLIRKHDIARKRCKKSDKRTCSYKYYVRVLGKELQVCRLAFAHIHGISPHKIRILCKKQDQNVMFPRDERGKHDNRPRKIPHEILSQIKFHIYSIVSSDRVCEFIREDKNNGPEVNISKMWKDYLEKHDPYYQGSFSGNSNTDISKDICGINEGANNQLTTYFADSELSGNHTVQNSHLTMDVAKCPTASAAETLELLGKNAVPQFCNSSIAEAPDATNKKRSPYIPIVKHWLYNKVFHEEFNVHDFATLKKKLCHIKNVSKTPSNHGSKSERKQKSPKKISRGKDTCVNIPNHVPPFITSPPLLVTATNDMQNITPDQCSNVYILPGNVPDITSQETDIITQPQHTMQFNLHAVSTQNNVLSPLMHVSGPTQSMQCSSVDLPTVSVNFSQNSCGYMNVNVSTFL